MAKVTIGGEKKEIPDGTTISELIVSENVETPEYVSVSINEEFEKRENFPTRVLQDGDEIEFLYFMGGGCGPSGKPRTEGA